MIYKEGSKEAAILRVQNDSLDILSLIFLLASLGLLENALIMSAETDPSEDLIPECILGSMGLAGAVAYSVTVK